MVQAIFYLYLNEYPVVDKTAFCQAFVGKVGSEHTTDSPDLAIFSWHQLTNTANSQSWTETRDKGTAWAKAQESAKTSNQCKRPPLWVLENPHTNILQWLY